jgi:hypothetical protein
VVTKLLILVNPDDIVYAFLFSLVMLIVDGLLEGVGNCGKGLVLVVVVVGLAKAEGEMKTLAIAVARIAAKAIISKGFSPVTKLMIQSCNNKEIANILIANALNGENLIFVINHTVIDAYGNDIVWPLW